MRKSIAIISMTVFFAMTLTAAAQEPIKLIGATMLPQEHVYYRVLEKFSEVVKENYDGPLEIQLHHSADIGTEKDAFEYMMQGVSIDFSIVSPAWMATWDKSAPFMDAPFLFSSIEHWEKCLNSGVFEPIAENIKNKGVRFIGYGGGGVRNLILNKPVYTTEDLPSVEMRVQGSPLAQKVFSATGIQATPMDYMEVYNAIKTGVLDGLENEPAGMEQMKFYEVAPYYVMSRHAITIRLLCFSESRFQSFPPALQEAILKAGEVAGKFHRDTEFAEGDGILKRLVEEGKLTVIEFDNTEMRNRALPVVEEYAKEIGAEKILEAVKSLQ